MPKLPWQRWGGQLLCLFIFLSCVQDGLEDDAQVSKEVRELIGLAILGEAKSDNSSEGKKEE